MIFDTQTHILAELLGPQDPTVQSLLWAANDPDMQQTAKELLEGLARSRGLDPQNPPAFGLPVGISVGDYLIGRPKCGATFGDEMGPTNDDLKGHIGVFGVTRMGKTSLLKPLLLSFTKGPGARPDSTFIVLDANDEYRDLSLFFSPDQFIWLTPDDLEINLLEVPTDPDGRRVMSPQQWIGRLREALRVLYVNDPTLNKFEDSLLRLYQERGVLAGGDDHPSISDLTEVLEREVAPPRSDRERAREKVIDRLRAIRSMLPGLDVRRSRNIHELFGHRCVCLNMAETSDVAIPFLFNVLVMILESAFRVSPLEPVRCVLLMEEAHRYLGSETYKRTGDLMESRGLAVLRSLRKAGFSGWVVTQLVSDLDRAVIGNLSSIICFRLVRSRCIAEAASALGLKPWQQRELAILPAREAIVRFSRHPGAIHLAVNDVSNVLPDPRYAPTREEARARSKPTLDVIPFVPARPQATSEAFHLPKRNPPVLLAWLWASRWGATCTRSWKRCPNSRPTGSSTDATR